MLDEIEHLFNLCNDLEPGKSSTTAGFEGLEAARREIAEARARATEAEVPLPAWTARERSGDRLHPPGAATLKVGRRLLAGR